jgi:hypothetical protein
MYKVSFSIFPLTRKKLMRLLVREQEDMIRRLELFRMDDCAHIDGDCRTVHDVKMMKSHPIFFAVIKLTLSL